MVFWGRGGVAKVMVVFAEGSRCWVAGWKKESHSGGRRGNFWVLVALRLALIIRTGQVCSVGRRWLGFVLHWALNCHCRRHGFGLANGRGWPMAEAGSERRGPAGR